MAKTNFSEEKWYNNKQIVYYTILPFLIGSIFLIANFFFIKESNPRFFAPMNLISAMIILVPPLLYQYLRYNKSKDIENRFPDFMSSIVERINSGMTLPQAIKEAAKGEYGGLTPLVRKMGIQMDWGIPFEKILFEFAKKSGSAVLARTATTIIETHRSGGNISDVLDAVTRNIIEINKIKAERSARIYAQMITGYVIFFVFLGVMIGLQKFLIPALGSGLAAESTSDLQILDFKQTFGSLIIIQAIFSGIAIGKMAEGSVIGGLKHSLVLLSVGYTIFILILG